MWCDFWEVTKKFKSFTITEDHVSWSHVRPLRKRCISCTHGTGSGLIVLFRSLNNPKQSVKLERVTLQYCSKFSPTYVLFARDADVAHKRAATPKRVAALKILRLISYQCLRTTMVYGDLRDTNVPFRCVAIF
jgi:hypothetical protein